jgi:hypothetical protein
MACQNEETKLCLAEVNAAQDVVRELEQSADIETLERSVSAIDKARAQCKKAGRGSEVEQLTGARNEISAHLELVRKKRGPPKPKMTPERLAVLVEKGDPDCPKGQAYKHEDAEIRCTGPQAIDMTLAEAKGYYARRGYKTALEDGGKELRAEYGSELYIFQYDSTSRPARCVIFYPPPGSSWQEATARMTGARPDKLEEGSLVPTARGQQPVTVESGETKLIVKIGRCAS